jgi:hypothetical protein
MTHFLRFVTPEEAVRGGDSRSVELLYLLASIANRRCSSCRTVLAWRYGGTGLCFRCETGEDDASDHYELTFIPWRWPLPTSRHLTSQASTGATRRNPSRPRNSRPLRAFYRR